MSNAPSAGQLAGRTALITGAGSGIGRVIAGHFAREGAAVMVTDVDAATAQRTAREIASAGGIAHHAQLDVANAGSVGAGVAATVERLGSPDILVNNAAIDNGGGILTTDEATWDKVQSVTLKGVYLMIRAVLPLMIAGQRGSIVNIASANGLTGLGSDAYAAAKAGVLNLTQNLAVQHGRHGVRVNAICPGTIATPAWSQRLERTPEVFERLAAWYPLRHVGTPEDVSELCLYLASDRSGFVTGSIFVMDGGLTAGIEALALRTYENPGPPKSSQHPATTEDAP